MKLTIKKKTLLQHLENVSRAIVSSNPFPALTGIVINASGSNIQLIVSNGNLSIKEIIEFNDQQTVVEQTGKILVPGKLFIDVIKKQSDLVTIEVIGTNINILSSGSKTTINLLNIDEYPTIAFESFGKELIIDSNKLNELIKNVSFASADNDKRIILNGVNLASANGKLTASATNSFRLAQQTVDSNSNAEFNITIVSKNLKDFMPVNANGELNIKVDDSKIITQYENSIIVSKLIDGVYPEVSRLIPSEFEATLTIDSKQIVDLIDKATVISDEESKRVRLSISNGELAIESRRSEIGDTKVKTTEFDFNKDSYSITFNAGFAKEAINKFKGMITINFTGEYKAFVIKGESNPNLVQLVLPHRTF